MHSRRSVAKADLTAPLIQRVGFVRFFENFHAHSPLLPARADVILDRIPDNGPFRTASESGPGSSTRSEFFRGGRMRVKAIVLALVALCATSAIASAQSQTGEIFGKATDASGAVLPGVTVTLTGPVLLQPLTAVTSETGTYQFPRLEIGATTVKFELTGFKTAVNEVCS